MEHKDLIEALRTLDRVSAQLDEELTATEGEVTEQTELLEGVKAALNELLTTEGVDTLGRWLKSKEDQEKALKAEKDYITRQINRCKDAQDYIRTLANEVLTTAGVNEVKGSYGYKFKVGTKTETAVDKEIIKSRYQECIEEAAHNIGVPADITITLGASVSKVAEGEELPDYYTRTVTGRASFTKPRANKNEATEQ